MFILHSHLQERVLTLGSDGWRSVYSLLLGRCSQSSLTFLSVEAPMFFFPNFPCCSAGKFQLLHPVCLPWASPREAARTDGVRSLKRGEILPEAFQHDVETGVKSHRGAGCVMLRGGTTRGSSSLGLT